MKKPQRRLQWACDTAGTHPISLGDTMTVYKWCPDCNKKTCMVRYRGRWYDWLKCGCCWYSPYIMVRNGRH